MNIDLFWVYSMFNLAESTIFRVNSSDDALIWERTFFKNDWKEEFIVGLFI